MTRKFLAIFENGKPKYHMFDCSNLIMTHEEWYDLKKFMDNLYDNVDIDFIDKQNKETKMKNHLEMLRHNKRK